MESPQKIDKTSKQKAERLVPAYELGETEFEELAGAAAAGLIRSGDVQYASGKIDQLQNRRETPGVVDTLFGPRRQQDAMQAALGPDGSAAVQKQIAKERTFGETHRALTGNSTTARQLIEQSLIGGAGGGLGLATTGDVTGAGGGVAAALLARHGGAAALRGTTAGREAKVAPVIAKILTDAGLPASVRNAATKAPDKVKEAIIRALMLNGVGPQLKPE